MPRPKREIPRIQKLIRFEPDVVQLVDDWDGGSDFNAKINNLVRKFLGSKRKKPAAQPLA